MTFLQSLPLVHVMASMRLKSESSKLALSYLWWIIEPLLFVAVFYIVFEKLLDRGEGDFLAFLIVGKIPFLWFSKTVNASANSLIAGRALMGQRDFPKHVFPYAIVQENTYKQAAVFIVLFVFIWVRGYSLNEHWVWMPVIMFVNYIFILPVSMLGAWIVVYIRDARMLIQMGTMFLLFSSGIFWDIRSITDIGVQELLITINPLAFLLDAYRQVLIYGAAPDWQHLISICAGSLTVLIVTHLVFVRYSQAIARKVLS